jgi:hypothetical protein
MTSWLTNGRPRQFWVMWENMRCSILFHFIAVPQEFVISGQKKRFGWEL